MNSVFYFVEGTQKGAFTALFLIFVDTKLHDHEKVTRLHLVFAPFFADGAGGGRYVEW